VEFGLYAKICMENGLTSLIRRMRKDRMVSDSAEDLLERYDDGRMEDPADAVIEKESGEALFAFIEKNLSAYEMRIWTLYLSGYTAKEIAVRLEKKTDAGTVKSVTNAIYRVRRKLRSLLGGS
jgi:DNA-directed RNA polymerase specialized sigma24 family protein